LVVVSATLLTGCTWADQSFLEEQAASAPVPPGWTSRKVWAQGDDLKIPAWDMGRIYGYARYWYPSETNSTELTMSRVIG
jgi:hypothetical protein